jgi:hypothetical protein
MTSETTKSHFQSIEDVLQIVENLFTELLKEATRERPDPTIIQSITQRASILERLKRCSPITWTISVCTEWKDVKKCEIVLEPSNRLETTQLTQLTQSLKELSADSGNTAIALNDSIIDALERAGIIKCVTERECVYAEQKEVLVGWDCF